MTDAQPTGPRTPQGGSPTGQTLRGAPRTTPTATVLFLAANPVRLAPLRLGDECRAIEDMVRAARAHNQLRFCACWAARPDDLLLALNQDSPSVLHFSGHGAGDHGLYFQAADGSALSVTATMLATVMRAAGGRISVVLLNACYSEVQAQALIMHVPCVIGMPGAIEDGAATTYAAAFYRALAFGKSVANAHEQGLAALVLPVPGAQREIAATDAAPRAVPTLLTRPGDDAACIYIVESLRGKAPCKIVINATLRELDWEIVDRVISELRLLSRDPSLQILDIEEGSVQLTVALAPEAAKHLVHLKDGHQLAQLCGLEVSSVTVPFAQGVLSSAGDLASAAQLLHGFNFDRVELETPRLSYEPRWSCQCEACAAVWIASKSGAVMRIGLSTPDGRPEQQWFPGDREARTIYHLHDGTALGGGSFLLIGRDQGTLDIVPDHHRGWTSQQPEPRRHGPDGSFHLDSWWAHGGEVTLEQGFERSQLGCPDYTRGVTAIAVLARPDPPDGRDTLDILVATRYPWLYLIEAANGRMRIRRRVPMPGWIQWIVVAPDEDRIVCISRGGDVVRFSYSELLEGRDGERTELSVLPTAAMPFGNGSVLLGTTTGLFVISEDRPEGVAIPVTRSAVLCLDQMVVDSHGDRHDYVAMGLQDGRLRIADADLLRALATGAPRPASYHNFAVEFDEAVLAVETLRPIAGPDDTAYVLAVLRDHSVRLFQVTAQRTLRERVRALWTAHVAELAGACDPADPLSLELAAARRVPHRCDRNVWKSMIIDVVLPRLLDMAPPGSAARRRIVDLACELSDGADRFVLGRLSTALAPLAGDDVNQLLELSRSILRAVPHSNDARWWAFIDGHLRELNALARHVTADDRARLVSWTRFVRKYMLLGNTFATKQFGLLELVEQNHETHKYLDALIYQTRLAQRCYDLRWKAELDDEVAQVHLAETGGSLIVVAVTVDGKLVFLDGTSGRRLRVHLEGDVLDALEPFGPARTLACAVAVDVDERVFRVIVSCTGADAPSPGLMIYDLRGATSGKAAELTAQRFPVLCADPTDPHAQHARVYALQPLPGRHYAFVAGLETRASPVGLVLRHAEGWTLELARDDAPTDRPEPDGAASPIERRSLAPGKMPTRAVAVAAVDDLANRYLVVTGSDDGLVCAISFAWNDAVRRWKIGRWDRVPDPIASVVLGRHRPHLEPDPDESQFSCYIGTTSGDIYALSIVGRGAPGTRTPEPPFGDYDARPLWRDTHDGPVLAVRLWRTPLFPADEVLSDEVLLVATESRLCIYNHSSSNSQRVSASSNYYFRGMRFDRIAMPERLRALTIVDDGREFVAAVSGRQLYMGKLVYLRDSIDRRDPEQRGGPPEAELADEMWARLNQLFAASRPDEPFEPAADQRDELRLELCELIRLEGGSLAAYVLRERLAFHEPWHELSPDELTRKARRLLDPLDPETPEGAARSKVILKSLTGAFLHRAPRALQAELLGHVQAPDRHAQIAAVCEVVTEYLMRNLIDSTRATVRLRIVAIRELMRVTVLRHMAYDDDHGLGIQKAIEAALDSCLRDDDRLVRIEALRAVSIMLRNVGVMADAARGERGRLLGALFPRGLGSITWLLKLIVGGLQRFPSFRRRTALISGAWYHISALLPLFRIFRDRTLALCDYLIRAGLGVDVVAMCSRSLRRQRTAAIRSRIEHLYLLPRIDRDDFIEHYDREKPSHQVMLKDLGILPRPTLATEWYEIDDAAMAHRLTELLDHLARMWSVRHREQITPSLVMVPLSAAEPDAPLAALERVVAALASVAGDLLAAAGGLATPNNDELRALDRLAELDRRHGTSGDSDSTLTAPIRTIVSGIVAAWRDVYDPPLPDTGLRIDRYRLGARRSEGGFGSLFELQEPRDLRNNSVIKVFRRLNSPVAAKRFLDGARFNKWLYDTSSDRQYIVEVTEVLDRRPYLAYVMPKYPRSLEAYLTDDFHNGPGALLWTEKVAEHIGRALRATHAEARCHGDVKPSNILVRLQGNEPTFHLGDFDLAYAAEDTEIERSLAPIRLVPERLSHKHPTDDTSGRRQWEDIVALTLVLYRMLTGTTIDLRDSDNLGKHIEELGKLARKARQQPAALHIIEALTCVLEPSYPSFDIAEFLSWISAPAQAEPPNRRVVRAASAAAPPPAQRTRQVILFLAANPVGTSGPATYSECAEIEREIRMTDHRDDFEFVSKWAVTVDDIMRHLGRVQPTIIHFSGHGGGSGDVLIPPPHRPMGHRDVADAPPGTIQVEDDHQQPHHVDARSLAMMIASAAPSARLVVLNACFSDDMAGELCHVVDCVVGMQGAIGDATARSFAVGFYRSLGNRRSVANAVDQARATLSGKNFPDALLPVYRTRRGVDASQLILPGRAPETAGAFAPNTSQVVKNIISNAAKRRAATVGRDIQVSIDELRERAVKEYLSGRRRLSGWQTETGKLGWTEQAWHLLGEALTATHEAIGADPNYQHAWTLLSDLYHCIGEMELASECLRRSYELATPGEHFPGRYYKLVKNKIDTGDPFSAGTLEREAPPAWFEDEYLRYLAAYLVS